MYHVLKFEDFHTVSTFGLYLARLEHHATPKKGALLLFAMHGSHAART